MTPATTNVISSYGCIITLQVTGHRLFDSNVNATQVTCRKYHGVKSRARYYDITSGLGEVILNKYWLWNTDLLSY